MKIQMIVTQAGKTPMQERFDFTEGKNLGREDGLINLYPSIEYQEIKGFGGAFTEAAAVTLGKLSQINRERVLKLYFSKDEGIGYNLGRIHINSCDFCLGNYTCVDEGDESLASFQIERDKKYVIPMIQSAQEYGG